MELIKKHSSSPVGGAETGSRAERRLSKAADHGEAGFAEQETEDSEHLAVKYYGGCNGGRKSKSYR